jgi:hypothetical protein
MKLTKNEREFLATFMAVAQKMLNSSSKSMPRNDRKTRRRRSAADVTLLIKRIRAARKREVPVRTIADDLGVTTAYVYQISK